MGKPKPRGGKKKAPAKKVHSSLNFILLPFKFIYKLSNLHTEFIQFNFQTTMVDSDDDDEVLELKDRLAAYNLDSSPDKTCKLINFLLHVFFIIFLRFRCLLSLHLSSFVLLAMEAESIAQEVLKKKAPSKRVAVMRGKSNLTISDDEDDMDEEEMPTISEDGDFQMVEAPKGTKAGAGRKLANAKANATTTTNTRKRGGAQGKKLLSQESITAVLKPVKNASPDKKVRKMRESPFNKKSRSVVGRTGSSVVEGDGQVAINRPKRENRTKVLYVESGSEEEQEDEEEPLTDHSDFEEEDDD